MIVLIIQILFENFDFDKILEIEIRHVHRVDNHFIRELMKFCHNVEHSKSFFVF